MIRLEMLLESKCEDIALNLSKMCLLTYNNSHPLELDFNQDEVDYITDIYFCTLLREKRKAELSNEVSYLFIIITRIMKEMNPTYTRGFIFADKTLRFGRRATTT